MDNSPAFRYVFAEAQRTGNDEFGACNWSLGDLREALTDRDFDPLTLARFANASADSIATMLDPAIADDPDDGRSPWRWFTLPNGDLIFGCFPCGATYFATEQDHHG